MTYNTQSKLHRRPVCSTEERRCLQCDSEQSLLKPLIPCLCSGWLRLRSAHLSSLRQVLPGGPAALLHGGPRHRRCHLLEGEPDVVIMHEIVTRREFESLQHKGRERKTALWHAFVKHEPNSAPVEPVQVWQDICNYILSFCPPQALSTDSIERLPVYNKTALKNYKVSQEADDWCIPSKEPLDLSNYKVAKWKCPPGLVLLAYIPWRLHNICLHIPMSSSVKADVGSEPFTTERVISRLKQTQCPPIFHSGFSSSMFMFFSVPVALLGSS